MTAQIFVTVTLVVTANLAALTTAGCCHLTNLTAQLSHCLDIPKDSQRKL